MRKPARLLLALGLTLAIVLAIQLAASARAGGGNNYVAPPSTQGGSSSSGGSHGGGYSGGGSSISFGSGSSGSSGTSIGGPFGVLLGILILGLVGYQWYRRNQGSISSLMSTVSSVQQQVAVAAIDEGSVQQGLIGLKARDPNFNSDVFLDRAQTTFFKLQNAWMTCNLEPARIYLSDGIYQRWKLQVEQMVAQHKRNVLENLVIGGCAIARVSGDPNIDSITVRIDASAADYDVDAANKIVRGDRTPRPFTEYWTFVRSRAARTRVGESAELTQCPNCGAPVQISESGVCAYCKAIVTSGQFGWVLDNITQASQWTAAA